MPNPTQNSISHRMPIWVGIVLLVTVVGLVWVYQSHTTPSSRAQLGKALGILSTGDFQGAVQEAEKVMQDSKPGTSEHRIAQSIVATSNYFGANPGEEATVQAVQAAKQQFAELSGKPVAQAQVVNTIISYTNSSKDPKVIAEIFKDPPFSQSFVQGSVHTSIKNLAEFSLTLDKTSTSLLTVATWHANQIIASIDGVKKLSAQDLATHVAAIKDLLAQADALHAKEFDEHKDTAFGFMYEPLFDFQEGYVNGALAMTDKSYLPASEGKFAKIFTYFDSKRSSGGNTISILETRLPYTHLDLAILINELGGPSRTADAKAHVDALLQLVTDNPQLHQNFFVSSMKTLGTSKIKGMLQDHERVAKLAAIDPAFKQFLVNNGWTF